MRDAWKKGDYADALVAARADITQYTIWHKSHTEPAAVMGYSAIEPLLKIDIAALTELVGNLCTLHFRLNRQDELPAILERVRANINDVRWQRKLTFLQALIADARGDHSTARREFSKLGAIRVEESDEEILQGYLDVFNDEIPFAKRIELCDRIIRISQKASDHLQYGGLKGISYMEIGDLQTAQKQFAAAIAYARVEAKSRRLSPRANLLMAGNLILLALLTRQEKHFVEAEQILKSLLIDTDTWSSKGRAFILTELGECYRYWTKWKEAEKVYRQLFQIDSAPIALVFLAECLVRQSQNDEAIRTIDSVDLRTLNAKEQVDYAYSLAFIAVESANRKRLQSALATLQNVSTTAPHFEQRRLELIIEVQNAIANGPTAGMWDHLRSLVSPPLRALSRYAIVQPNVMGLGININRIIDDATEPRRDVGQSE